MPLNRWQRKERLPFGAQKEIADDLAISESTVSLVMNDKTDTLSDELVRKVRVAIARKIGVRVDDAFAPDQPAAA